MRALQKALLERLRAVDPGSTGTEHAIYDAHARARIAGDRVYIDISGPGAPPQKKPARTVRYAGIQTQVLSGDVIEQGYQFACRPRGFGERQVRLAFVSRPRRVIAAVHRLLLCASGPPVALARADRRGTALATGWRRVAIDPNPQAFVPAESIEVHHGRLAVTGAGPAGCCDIARLAWSSADGHHWRPDRRDPSVILDGRPGTSAAAFARRGQRRVAVGQRARPHGETPVVTSAAWLSDDGLRWRRVPDDPRVFGNTAMQEVWTTPAGFVAFGLRYLDRSGERQVPMVWRSRDGRSWRRDRRAAARIPHDAHPDGYVPPAMTKTRAGIVALTHTDAWLSQTGAAWTHTARLPGPDRGDWDLHDAGRVLFAVRSAPPLPGSGRASSADSRLEVLRTTDARHYEALGAAFGPSTNAAVAVIARIPTGWLASLDQYAIPSTLWFSRDGRRFHRVTRPGQFHAGHIHDIAHDEQQIILVGGVTLRGRMHPSYRATAWLHRLR